MKTIFYDEFKDYSFDDGDFEPVDVCPILEDVKRNGDDALCNYSLKFDGVVPVSLRIEKENFYDGFDAISSDTRKALENTARNLKRFAEKQLEQSVDFQMEIAPGVFAGQRIVPLQRVGVYVPGGNFPLVSSLLMGAVPARVAGVKEIAACTPPGPDGKPHPAMLAAAAIAGIDELFTVGGVQAVAAMAYGTETIRAVDKIVGPGNRFVTAAKKEVFGTVGIDFIAGPSEVMVIADHSANPAWIAADLLAQAEHDALAIPILVTTSPSIAQQVEIEIQQQLSILNTRDIAQKAIQTNGLVIIVESLEQAAAYANRRAPEHLELHLENSLLDSFSKKLTNYGTLFIGDRAAEVLGDYSAGVNHTLPTNRAARYTGGLSVKDFIKVQTTLEVTGSGPGQIASDAWLIAQLEGLSAHANAAAIRL